MSELSVKARNLRRFLRFLRRAVEFFIQRVRFLLIVHDVKGGIAIFTAGIFEIVYHFHNDDERPYDTEQKEKSADSRRHDRPHDAEACHEDADDAAEIGRSPSGLYAFHNKSYSLGKRSIDIENGSAVTDPF